MKTVRSFLLTLAAGCILLSAIPRAHAQQTLRVDSAGNPTTPLNLGGDHIAGTVPPAHLGTGTPSSWTVLRGDGTWVGTTPTGNTIASTGNLLLGDGAGNAAAVGSNADLARILQMRADTRQALTSAPDNLVGTGNLVIRNATHNPDGTITIPANDYVQWNPTDGVAPAHLHYCYVAATTAVPVSATNGLCIRAYSHGYQNIDYSSTGTEGFANPAPGVARYVFNNFVYGQYYDYAIYVVNGTGAPVTIYPPVVSLADAGLLPVPSFAESVPVPSQPVTDLDFTRFASEDRSGRYLAEKQTTLAADSVNGANTNAGTLYAPKLTLQQTVANGTQFGLYRGSTFRDSLPLSTLGNTHGIVVQDLSLGSEKPLLVISALATAPNGSVGPSGTNTYSYSWMPTETLTNDGYQNVYVVEINTATEAALPIASRRRMTDVTTQAAATSTVGSAWVFTGPTSGGWTAVFHPSDGLAPGSGSYRYEVVSRYAPANWGAPANLGDGAMSGVELVGSNWGYGSLGGPTAFVGDRLAILHGTTHGAVIGGGSLQRSVFYEGGDPTAIQLAWYTADPTGLSWDTRHCLFYADVGDRPANFLISHSSGNNYARGDISDCAFIGARWSDGSLRGVGIDYVNVNAGTINRVYVQGVADSFGGSMPAGVEIRNSVFRQVCHTPVGGRFHDNVVAAESASNPADANYRSPACFSFNRPGAVVTNNLFWAHGLSTALNEGNATAFTFGNNSTTATARRNVIVLDPASGGQSTYCFNFPADVSGVSLDYNLVVCTSTQISTGGVKLSWADYRAAYPTLDAHSLFVDLSADPRGLKAVFLDPANGDFRWAQTDVARRCAAYCAANHVGPATVPSRWPVVPTVDEAVRLISGL